MRGAVEVGVLGEPAQESNAGEHYGESKRKFFRRAMQKSIHESIVEEWRGDPGQNQGLVCI